MESKPIQDPIVSAPDVKLFQQNYVKGAHLYSLWSLEDAYPQGRLRYHLGQVCMLSLLNTLANNSYKVSCVICDPWHQKFPDSQVSQAVYNINVTRQFIDSLKDESIRVSTMSTEIDSMEKYDKERFKIIRGFARNGYTVLMDFIRSNPLPGNVRSELHRCRTYSTKNGWPAPVREYSDQLAAQFIDVPEEELMAAVYATTRSPKWFNSDWISEVCAWLVMTASQKSDVVIIEANRGAYSWLTHRCVLKIGLIEGKKDVNTFQMPKNCYVTPVLSVDGSRPMELANREGCLFVDTPLKELSDQIAAMSLLTQGSVIEWLRGSNSIGAMDNRWADGVKELLTTARDEAGRLIISREPIESLAGTAPLSRTEPKPAAQTPDKATPSNSVISIHGINTTAPWQKSLTSALSSAGLLHFPYDYGKFSVIRFACKGSRQKILKDFIEFYAAKGFGKKNAPSIVAHSFGSYIVCKALSNYADIHFKNVILLGSIVDPMFNWSQLRLGGRVNAVLNEMAANDIWVSRATYIVPDAGPSGQSGFIDLADGAVIERRHPEFEHSDAINGLAYATAWLEFIRTGKIEYCGLLCKEPVTNATTI